METLNTRTQEFVGTIRKCPNCGAIVEAFQTRCSSCGFEFNNVRSSNAVEEFFRHIENFDAEQAEKDAQEESQKANDNADLVDMAKDYFKNIGKEIFDFKASQKSSQDEAQGLEYVSELAKKKAQFIKNFVIPVDKQSLFEFMSLAISHYDPKLKRRFMFQHNDASYLNESWKTKIREVYTKCVLAFEPNSSEMQKIDKIMAMLEGNSEKKEKNGKVAVIGGPDKKTEKLTSKIQDSDPPKKRKHGCLTAFLVFVIVTVVFFIISTVFLYTGGFDKLTNEMINQSSTFLENQNTESN